MKLLGRQRTHLLIGFLASFCLSSQSFSQEAPLDVSTTESPYRLLANRIELFGGLYYDTDGVLTILLKTGASSIPGQEISLSSSERSRLQNIIADIHGAEALLPVLEGRPPVPTLRIRTSKYTWAQLNSWQAQLESAPKSAAKVTSTGLTERDDRFVISVGLEESTGPAVNEIEKLIDQLVIPRDAIVIEEVGVAEAA